MTAGEGIKRGAEGTKNVTDKTVDAVENKVNDVTSAVGHAMESAVNSVHRAASKPREPKTPGPDKN